MHWRVENSIFICYVEGGEGGWKNGVDGFRELHDVEDIEDSYILFIGHFGIKEYEKFYNQ